MVGTMEGPSVLEMHPTWVVKKWKMNQPFTTDVTTEMAVRILEERMRGKRRDFDFIGLAWRMMEGKCRTCEGWFWVEDRRQG